MTELNPNPLVPLTDEQIDELFNLDSKFIARRAIDKSGYEVVEMMNDDWREVITDAKEVRGTFDTYEKAEVMQRRLHVRWVLGI